MELETRLELVEAIHRHVELKVNIVELFIELGEIFVRLDCHDNEFEWGVVTATDFFSITIGEVTGHGDLANAAEFHADNALVPAFD